MGTPLEEKGTSTMKLPKKTSRRKRRSARSDCPTDDFLGTRQEMANLSALTVGSGASERRETLAEILKHLAYPNRPTETQEEGGDVKVIKP
jgi:hypothetical protein